MTDTQTAEATRTYIADIDRVGSEMERPFMRVFVVASSDDEARENAQQMCDDGERVRAVEPLQPILDLVRSEVAQGKRYTLSWKSESGNVGPATLINNDLADQQRTTAVPFGSDPEWLIGLPWMKRAEARRLATYIGVPYEEW